MDKKTPTTGKGSRGNPKNIEGKVMPIPGTERMNACSIRHTTYSVKQGFAPSVIRRETNGAIDKG